MNRRHLFLFPWLLPALTGCVPNATTYYRPSYEGGRVGTGHCVPTESHLFFQVGPAALRATGSYDGSVVILEVLSQFHSQREHLPLSDWKVLRFTTGTFAVRDLDSGVTTQNLTVRVLRPDKSDSVLEPYQQRVGKDVSNFYVEVYLPTPPAKRFDLLSPPIDVDGKEFAFPTIRFEKKLWVGISPFC